MKKSFWWIGIVVLQTDSSETFFSEPNFVLQNKKEMENITT